jgi:hypothetical protein
MYIPTNVHMTLQLSAIIFSFCDSTPGLWPLLQFLNPIHSRYDSLDRGSARHKAATYTQNNTRNKRTQSFMPRLGFEPTTLVFELEKMVHTLQRAVTVIDHVIIM